MKTYLEVKWEREAIKDDNDIRGLRGDAIASMDPSTCKVEIVFTSPEGLSVWVPVNKEEQKELLWDNCLTELGSNFTRGVKVISSCNKELDDWESTKKRMKEDDDWQESIMERLQPVNTFFKD